MANERGILEGEEASGRETLRMRSSLGGGGCQENKRKICNVQTRDKCTKVDVSRG
jgi:hypothetical protein